MARLKMEMPHGMIFYNVYTLFYLRSFSYIYAFYLCSSHDAIVQQVRWDEDIGNNHQERISPWEIDPSVSLPPLSIQSSPRLKKMRTSLQATPPSNPVTGMNLPIRRHQTLLVLHALRLMQSRFLISVQQEQVGTWTLRNRLDPLRSCKVKKI